VAAPFVAIELRRKEMEPREEGVATECHPYNLPCVAYKELGNNGQYANRGRPLTLTATDF
jgi:hypothetical protein